MKSSKELAIESIESITKRIKEMIEEKYDEEENGLKILEQSSVWDIDDNNSIEVIFRSRSRQ